MANFFQHLIDQIKAWLNGVEDTVADAFHAFVTDIEQSGGEVLMEAAMAAVKAAEDTKGTGAEKFKAAIDAVKDTIVAKGLVATENAVQGAVLVAVAKLNADQGQGSAPAVDPNASTK